MSILHKKIAGFIFFLIIICVAAQLSITIPSLSPDVPITGQTLAILVAAYFLGPYWGLLTIICYLALGALGLPVFAGGSSGIEKFLGPTGGYLLGFVPGTLLVGMMQRRKYHLQFGKIFFCMFLGNLLIMINGVIQLGAMKNFDIAFKHGFFPFIPGAVIKIILGSCIVFMFYKYWEDWLKKLR